MNVLPTIDARGAAVEALSTYLSAACFSRWGGDSPDEEFKLSEVRQEWPEPDQQMVYPSATIIDRQDIVADSFSFVPQPIEDTWGTFGECTVLWKLAEMDVPIQVDFWASDVGTREAIAARLPSLFAPGEDATRVMLPGSSRYYMRGVRASLISWRRMDEASTSYVRERRLMAVIQLSIDVVELRRGVAFQPQLEFSNELPQIEEDEDMRRKLQVVEVFVRGPEGPPGRGGAPGPEGPGGPTGPPSAFFDYDQPTPSALWVINHNLGFRPSVELFTLAGVEMDADVQHVSLNQVNVTFLSPTAGSARCT